MRTLLWLDDLHDPYKFPHITDKYPLIIWARNYDEFTEYFDSFLIHAVSLDNDLGEEMEGKDCLRYVESVMFDSPTLPLREINIHSHNSSAVDYMYSSKESLKEKYDIDVTKIRR